ncbi:uncharacterized protein PAC_06466 [Phialocephala subalpina]|uniref:Uncharacterized protein n=1 Tax=Phialocephala subalpina TaxID=576137 RepID=A0A1L7WUW2_9HELO|nr:uncharacterized protein PAC_06466 [Phialocephala subalpina]
MHSTTITLLSLTMATVCHCQDSPQPSSTALFLPNFLDGWSVSSLVAEVLSFDATATYYAFQCAPGAIADDCDFPGTATLTAGAATAAYTYAPQVNLQGTTTLAGYVDCSLAYQSAVCSYSETSPGELYSSSTTLTGDQVSPIPFVITAVAAQTTGTSKTTPATTANAQTSGSSSGATPAQTSSPSSKTTGTSAGASTSTSTGAGAAITGAPAWMLRGAAVALAAIA